MMRCDWPCMQSRYLPAPPSLVLHRGRWPWPLCNLTTAEHHRRSSRVPQERAESRKASGLCHSLVRGVPCQFGKQCRFNHDVAAFLRSRGPELPGQCPFQAADTCLYGVSLSTASESLDLARLCSPAMPRTRLIVRLLLADTAHGQRWTPDAWRRHGVHVGVHASAR